MNRGQIMSLVRIVRRVVGIAACWCCAAVLISTATTHAAEFPVAWQVGPDVDRQLQQPVTIVWTATPLREALLTLGRNQRVGIVLDRRVDPGQLITLQAQQEPLGQLLTRLAGQLQLGQSRLGNVIYLGPVDAAAKLRTVQLLTQQAALKQSVELRTRLSKVQSWHWDILSEPRVLANHLAAEAQLAWNGSSALPHDLWNETDLPPLPWHDRLLLLGVQFDRAFTIDAAKRELRWEAFPAAPTIERSYSLGKDPRATIERYRKLAPQATIEQQPGKLVVRGRIEDHELLAPPAVKTPTTVGKGIDVYSLTLTDVPLGQFFGALEKQLGLTFSYDADALQRKGITLQQRVSFKVEQQTLDVLLAAALDPVGLTFRRQEKRVEVLPK